MRAPSCVRLLTLASAMLSPTLSKVPALFCCPFPLSRLNLPFYSRVAFDRRSGVSSPWTHQAASRRSERAGWVVPRSQSNLPTFSNRKVSAPTLGFVASSLHSHGPRDSSRHNANSISAGCYQTHRNMATATKKDGQKIVAYDPENVFKKILEGKIPCHKIFETEHVIAILDAFPAVEGHSLLIPKANVASVFDLDPETAANLYKELPRLCRAVQQATGCEGVNVLQNNGKAAGQVVFHAHVHVVPRYSGDQLFKQFASAKEMIQPPQAESILAKIKAHL
uniref:HIT family protein, related n=2 Tax=Neospora caninum (strain Liverpool) TaxID=572307 RepID=A0A0F7UAI0_NEOCL|nr:TPA: HIT family protein, related [Neospora caninum Liverpool]